jgi:hypothetical protein
MRYKGFEITITEHISGYGWVVTGNEVNAETPKDTGDKIYTSRNRALTAAKAKINQLIRHGF